MRLSTTLFLLLVLNWPSPARANFFDLCRRVNRAALVLFSPDEKITRSPTSISAQEGGVLAGTPGETRYVNGSYVIAADAEGKQHHLLVLSDYFMGHRSHEHILPNGWKIKERIHRGEYEIVDGRIVKGNSTSGKAHDEGAENSDGPVRALLEGTGLLAPNFRFEPFKKGEEHLYVGFNEPGGTPVGLHTYRARMERSLEQVQDLLELSFYAMLAAKGEAILEGPTPHPPIFLLRHWDIITMSVPKAERHRLASLREGLENAARGDEVAPAVGEAMLEGIKWIKKYQKAFDLIELPPAPGT